MTCIPGKERPDVRRDKLLEEKQRARPPPRPRPDRSSRNRGRVAGSLTRAKRSVPAGIPDDEGQVEAHVRDVGEGPSGVDGKRRENGEDDLLEVAVRLRPSVPGPARHSRECGLPRPRACGKRSRRRRARFMHQLLRACANRLQLLSRCEPG